MERVLHGLPSDFRLPAFAAVLVVAVSAVGVFSDYAHANSARRSMQAACDKTTAMLVKDAAEFGPMDQERSNDAAQNYFDALFDGRTVVDDVTVSVSVTGPDLVVAGAATMPTRFLKLIGKSSIAVRAQSLRTLG